MAKSPGGEPATRPLHFIWIADGSLPRKIGVCL